jgi:hypothetical protein
MRRMVAAQCVILVASTLLIRPVSAVGLGQLSAESAINQPLNVRVELLDLGTTALEEITVQLATAEDFARLGVEPNAALPRSRWRGRPHSRDLVCRCRCRILRFRARHSLARWTHSHSAYGVTRPSCF